MPSATWAEKLGYVVSNQLLVEVCVFARNILIARFIGAETLGEFIFLVLSMRLFTMSTDLAAERHIMQANEADLKGALAAAHFTVRLRGFVLAFILIFMGLHDVNGISLMSYSLLATASVLNGLTHQGYRLKQRSLNFRPALYVEGATTILGTLAVYVAVGVAPVLEAVCACVLAQAAMQTSLSHITADAPYRANTSTTEIKRLFHFGFPLLLTGVAMFWSMQGERLLLSAVLPADEFAHFSMMFQLALVPILMMSRMMLTIGLPYLASLKGNWSVFERRLGQLHMMAYVAAFGFAGCFLLFANPVLGLLFGAGFKTEIMLIALVAIAQALRLCRAPQSVAAQALGQTDIPFKANLVRVAAALIGAASMFAGGSIATLLTVACIGEGIAWAAQGLLFSLRNRVASRTGLPQLRVQEISQ